MDPCLRRQELRLGPCRACMACRGKVPGCMGWACCIDTADRPRTGLRHTHPCPSRKDWVRGSEYRLPGRCCCVVRQKVASVMFQLPIAQPLRAFHGLAILEIKESLDEIRGRNKNWQ